MPPGAANSSTDTAAVLQKPFPLDTLARKIRSLLDD